MQRQLIFNHNNNICEIFKEQMFEIALLLKMSSIREIQYIK